MTKDRAKWKAQKYREWAEIAKRKQLTMLEQCSVEFKEFDWTEPVKLGHHSQRRHEKMFERRDAKQQKISELETKIRMYERKARHLDIFVNRNKGDAMREAEKYRKEVDSWLKLGMMVEAGTFGVMTVVKINEKSVKCKKDDWGILLDKIFLRKI